MSVRGEHRAPLVAVLAVGLLTLPVVAGVALATASADRGPAAAVAECTTSTTPAETSDGTGDGDAGDTGDRASRSAEDECQTDEPDGAFSVEDAVFRWGVNDESNNRAFAPGTFNFLSAGKTPNPGKGGQTIRNRRWQSTGDVAWRPRAKQVRIEKLTTGGAVPATWAGLFTGPAGEEIPSATSGVFSQHQVVITGGTGTVDPDARTATITWEGSFSVIHYSGMNYFNIQDPTLRVTPQRAVITATASGYGSSRDDQSKWVRLPDTKVTLAVLRGVDRATLAEPRGFTADARYRGVRYDAPGSIASQVRSGADWGAFPTNLLNFLVRVGNAPYWYSSGGSTDGYKTALPVTVSWDSRSPIEPDDPTPTTTTPSAQPSNSPGEDPPTDRPTQPLPTDPAPTQPTGPTVPTVQAASDPALAAGSPYQPPTAYALTAAGPDGGDGDPSSIQEWVLGAVLLVGAAVLTAAGSGLIPVLNRRKGT